MNLKILTLNTWQERGPWQERWEIIFAGLKSYSPDIVAFQEVFNMKWADEVQKRSGYPHLVKSNHDSGLIFLSKYPVKKSECIILKTKSTYEDYLRYCHFALFVIGKKRLNGFNTHLSWQLLDDETRLKQVEEIRSFEALKSIGGWFHFGAPRSAFIAGDFNSSSNKPAIESVKSVWDDTFAIANPLDDGLTWNYTNPFAERARARMPERRIDYIFTSQLIKGAIGSSKVVFDQPDSNGIFASDHFGVMTEIELE